MNYVLDNLRDSEGLEREIISNVQHLQDENPKAHKSGEGEVNSCTRLMNSSVTVSRMWSDVQL